MFTLAVISQKGGSGKTTGALNIAVAFERLGLSTLVIDLDPQGSAKAWAESRTATAPVVLPCHASELGTVVNDAKANGADFVMIDTAPHSEDDAFAAAQVANLILIPCRPSILDLWTIAATRDIAIAAKTPAVAVINAAPPRGSAKYDAARAITNSGVKVLAPMLTQRAAFGHSLTCGQAAVEYEPKGKAAREVEYLCRVIRRILNKLD